LFPLVLLIIYQFLLVLGNENAEAHLLIAIYYILAPSMTVGLSVEVDGSGDAFPSGGFVK
jgi:hypothetical protein